MLSELNTAAAIRLEVLGLAVDAWGKTGMIGDMLELAAAFEKFVVDGEIKPEAE